METLKQIVNLMKMLFSINYLLSSVGTALEHNKLLQLKPTMSLSPFRNYFVFRF